MTIRILFCAAALLSAGCTAYQAASVRDGVISNPTVGWNGYSIRIPEGVERMKTSADEEAPSREAEIRAWYEESNNKYVGDYYTSMAEQLLFENPEQSYLMSFISETYELSAGWQVMSSVDKQYIIQKLIYRKMVVINDMDAHHEQLEINGQRGWYVSGTARPYFRKKAQTTAYEGIFLLGNLKEAYWIEAFGAEAARDEMKKQVYEMAESLEVY